MSSRWRACLVLLFLALTAIAALAGNDWLPITPEDLKAGAPPEAAGASAYILYHQADYDDQQSVATHYYRIKVLTEEGKKRADVQIAFYKDSEDINDIKARTIHPDGSIVDFGGKVYEKTVVKAGNVRMVAKSFTMSSVTPGSIIEYRYKEHWSIYRYYAPDWIVQEDMFLRKAHFTMTPSDTATIAWIWADLPKGVQPQEKHNVVSLDVENIPAFEHEEFTPPEREVKARVEFYYLIHQTFDTKKVDQFWKEYGKRRNEGSEEFIGHHGDVGALAISLVSPSDTIEQKLRKLYVRVQQLRNTSFEADRSDQELKREKRKDNQNASDVLKHGYGNRLELTMLFVAMARAVGIESRPVLIPERDERFFHESVPNVYQFNSMVAGVKLPNGTALLDPGTPYCPFGLLAWYKTGVRALELNKDGAIFVTTNLPLSRQAVRVRSADLTMDDEGQLRGTLKVTYAGQSALNHRLEQLRTDQEGWKKDFVDQVKDWLPAGAKATLQSIDGATDSDHPLTVVFQVEMSGVMSSTGKRIFVPTTLFQVDHPFSHAERKYPVYFSYPFQDIDEVKLHLPAIYAVDSMPAPHVESVPFATYSVERQVEGNVLNLRRSLVMEDFYFPPRQYNELRKFYQSVASDDDEQVVAKHVQPKGM